MNLRVFFIYICKTAHFGWLRTKGLVTPKSERAKKQSPAEASLMLRAGLILLLAPFK